MKLLDHARELIRIFDPGPDGRGPENRAEEYLYAWKNGWRWTWYYVKFRRGLAPTLRCAYWTFVRGHITEVCQYCGRPVEAIWWSNEKLWRRFSGSSSDGGILCVRCFDSRAAIAGAHLVWKPYVSRERGEQNEETERAVWGVE